MKKWRLKKKKRMLTLPNSDKKQDCRSNIGFFNVLKENYIKVHNQLKKQQISTISKSIRKAKLQNYAY